MIRALAAALLLAGAGCTKGISGTVVDADNGRPVANATVDIFTTGWGFSDRQLVWDKTRRHRTITDAAGRYRLAVSGGINLTVTATDYRPTITSQCADDTLVRIGGPYANDMRTGLASIGVEAGGRRMGWSFAGRGHRVPEAEADLALDGPAPDLMGRAFRIAAPLGMALVEGSGNPPTAPAGGYTATASVGSNLCGWLFVRTRDETIVAVDPKVATEQDPDGARFLLLTYRMPDP